MTSDTPPPHSWRAACIVGWLGLVALLVANAWVCEDAYISFRVVDNFVHGYGLRWNVDERVQVYTHPLWLLLHIPFYALYRNVFLVTIGLSLASSTAAVAVVARSFRGRPLTTLGLLLMPLALSRSFVDFSSSGLENPLTFLLVACFGWCLARSASGQVPWLGLSLSASLALVNRLDTAVALAPGLIYLVLAHRRALRWRRFLAGWLPIVAWELFSLVYYGFLFPNPKYAKLNTGIPLHEYLLQGLRYGYTLIQADPASVVLLFAGAGLSLYHAREAWRGRTSSGPLAAFGAGILSSTLYVLSVGGDFMYGRFWSLPIFMAVWLLYATLVGLEPLVARARWRVLGLLALMLSLQIATRVFDYYETDKVRLGVADERAIYAEFLALFDPATHRLRTAIEHPWQEEGREFGASGAVESTHNVGLRGYAAGPQAIVVDLLALTDPLLARLPERNEVVWRIGHFHRDVPAHYLEVRAGAPPERLAAPLDRYYRALMLVTRGELLSPERLRAIVDFQIGRYDRLRDEYVEKEIPRARRRH